MNFELLANLADIKATSKSRVEGTMRTSKTRKKGVSGTCLGRSWALLLAPAWGLAWTTDLQHGLQSTTSGAAAQSPVQSGAHSKHGKEYLENLDKTQCDSELHDIMNGSVPPNTDLSPEKIFKKETAIFEK